MAELGNTEQNRLETGRAAFTEMSIMLDSEQSLANFRERTGTTYPTSTLTTPSPSPDEMVIQRRGRRHIPIVFSPDIDYAKQNNGVSSTEELDKSLKSTPRKRLFYEPETPSPENYSSGPFDPKQLRYEPKGELPEDTSLLSAVQALTSNQLISIVRHIINDHPDVEMEIRSYFPKPDLKPLEERIRNLQKNIKKCLPTTRFFQKTDKSWYNRVAIHILEFKNFVIDQGRRLVESQQWPIVMEYVFMAWDNVRLIPIWDNSSHNAARKECFKSLSEMCEISLKNMKDTLDEQTKEIYRKKLELWIYDCNENIEECLDLLKTKKFN